MMERMSTVRMNENEVTANFADVLEKVPVLETKLPPSLISPPSRSKAGAWEREGGIRESGVRS